MLPRKYRSHSPASHQKMEKTAYRCVKWRPKYFRRLNNDSCFSVCDAPYYVIHSEIVHYLVQHFLRLLFLND